MIFEIFDILYLKYLTVLIFSLDWQQIITISFFLQSKLEIEKSNLQ